MGPRCSRMAVTHVPVNETSVEVWSREGNIQERLQERLRIQTRVSRYRDVRRSRVQTLPVTGLLLCCSWKWGLAGQQQFICRELSRMPLKSTVKNSNSKTNKELGQSLN